VAERISELPKVAEEAIAAADEFLTSELFEETNEI